MSEPNTGTGQPAGKPGPELETWPPVTGGDTAVETALRGAESEERGAGGLRAQCARKDTALTRHR